MPTFGHRGTPSPPRPRPRREGDGPSLARPDVEGRAFWLIVIMTVSLFFYGQKIVDAVMPPAAADLTPGQRYDIGPYDVASGCPLRSWSVGDYAPRACLMGHQWSSSEQIGLQTPDNPHRAIQNYYWVDASADALLVGCPAFTACRVMRVTPDRFLGRSRPPPAEDAALYHHPSPGYLAWMSWMIGGTALLPLMMVYAAFRWSRNVQRPRDRSRGLQLRPDDQAIS